MNRSNISNKKTAKVLKSFFTKKQSSNSQFSLRNFAQKLGVSPAFASRILNGNQDLPIDRLDQIAELLEIDSPNLSLIKKNLILDYLKKFNLTPSEYSEFFSTNKTPIEAYKEISIPEKEFNLFDPWYNAALLDYSTCSNFKLDFAWIEKKLNVPRHELEKAWNYLIAKGYINITGSGKFEKSDKNIRLSTTKSILSLRRFHKHMISKALTELNTKIEQPHFQRRLITSATIALDPEKLNDAKKMIMNFIMELSLFCSKSDQCKEVYAFSALFFPLTEDSTEK